MAIKLDVRADIKEAQALFRHLGPGVAKAAARALNDSIVTVRAEGARAIKRQHPAMRVGDIKKEMNVKKAYHRHLVASVDTTGKPLSLLSFKARDTRKGVTAQVGRKRHTVEMQGRKAFFIPKYGGEVFVRRAATGRQIRRVRGVSMPSVFRARSDEFEEIAKKRWAVTFPNRLRFEIAKAEAKARSS